MTSRAQLYDLIANLSLGHEVVVVTDRNSPTATIMARNPETGLLYSPLDVTLEHIAVDTEPDPFPLPVIGDQGGFVEGAPHVGELFVGATIAGRRFSGRHIVQLTRNGDSSDVLRKAVRGVADQVAKVAGEYDDAVPTGEVSR